MRSRELVGPLAKLAPQGSAAVVSERSQLFLVEADQRRDEQASEVEVIVGLDGEAARGEQVLDGERLVQMQPVDSRDGHSGSKQPRNDERSELAPAPHQHQDVT